ncbi:hypothetical protein PUR61_36965 [Streptomyces sp. BE20]|uniref:hypothetical protein n=1 Tax=Streptomyces sp. BE20 TaxID=3002525 RepID=UPI002E77B052|nr:hypothetical protein [Streptomyces sp. BE20]MEE1827725.1 hypothetical protein [Streptomyces sp. BE20]
MGEPQIHTPNLRSELSSDAAYLNSGKAYDHSDPFGRPRLEIAVSSGAPMPVGHERISGADRFDYRRSQAAVKQSRLRGLLIRPVPAPK